MKDVGYTMYAFYEQNKDFAEFCHKCMKSYKKKLTEVLESPITYEYYKSMQKGGMNESITRDAVRKRHTD